MPRFRNVRGAEFVERGFKRVSREGAELVAAAINKGTEEVAEYAELLAPKDTFELSQDIKTDIVEGKRGTVGLVLAGTRPDTAGKARAQEFGRRPSADGHPGHIDQEFMFPAYFARRERVIGRVRRAVAKAAKLFSRDKPPAS